MFVFPMPPMPVVPRKAVAEVSKIENLQERLGCDAWVADRIR